MRNNKLKKVLHQITGLSAIGFPGFYRLFSVFFIGAVFSQNISNQYAEMFLYVCYINALIGVPLSSMYLEKDACISLLHSVLYVVFASLLVSAFSIIISNKLNFDSFAFLVLSTIFASIYEFLRQIFINNLQYKPIFWSGVASTVLFVLVSMLSSNYIGYGVSVISFFCLSGPLIAAYIFRSKGILSTGNLSFRKLSEYTLISALSTAVSFLLPILLLKFLTDNQALEVAKATAIITILMLFPRYVSNTFVKELRVNSGKADNISRYLRGMYVIVLVSMCAYLALVLFFKMSNCFLYLLLFLAIYLSQLSLPYSCVFTVNGESRALLKINLLPTLTLFVIISGLGMLGILTENIMLMLFIAYQLIKFFISREVFKSGNYGSHGNL